jgi:Amt family ammonium transporter
MHYLTSTFSRLVRQRRIYFGLVAVVLGMMAAAAHSQAPPKVDAPATNPPAVTTPTPTASAPTTPAPVSTADPTGATTANSGQIVGSGISTYSQTDIDALTKDKDKPATKGDVLKSIDATGQTAVSLNLVWVLVAGFLVMFMQLGFAMVETGFTRAKNAAHVCMMNLLIYGVGMLGFWLVGYALMFGGNGGALASVGGSNILGGHEFAIGKFGLFGTFPFMLHGTYDVGVYASWLFAMVFMDTAATIPTGALAERWRFTAFLVYGLFMACLCYPIYGHWVWGGGWLSQMGVNFGLGHGAVDFAGSGVVHMVGGVCALAGVMVLGPRIGKYVNGKSVAIKGHDIPMATFGTLILAFGWFGFNAGSTFGAAGSNLRLVTIAVNTMLASGAGSVAAALLVKAKTKVWDPGMMINGLLGGLVAITAPCAFVDSTGAVIIGVIAGLVVPGVTAFIDEKMKLDDPVGAITVHGVCGAWGVIAVGIFADGTFGGGLNGVGADKYLGVAGQGVTGLLGPGHDVGQFMAQLISVVACFVWVFGSSWVFFKVQSMFMRIRLKEADEIAGSDISEMGGVSYYLESSHIISDEEPVIAEMTPDPDTIREVTLK